MAGVKEYFILDPGDQYMRFYRLAHNGRYAEIPPAAEGIIRSNVLPGFQFRRSDLLNLPNLSELALDQTYAAYVIPDFQNAVRRAERAEERAAAEAAARRPRRRTNTSPASRTNPPPPQTPLTHHPPHPPAPPRIPKPFSAPLRVLRGQKDVLRRPLVPLRGSKKEVPPHPKETNMEPEITQAMKDYANFMELYVEPVMATLYHLGINIAPALIELINLVTTIAAFLSQLTGLAIENNHIMDNGHLLIEPIEPLCIGLIIAATLAGALYFIYPHHQIHKKQIKEQPPPHPLPFPSPPAPNPYPLAVHHT